MDPSSFNRYLSLYGLVIRKRDFGEGNSFVSIIDRENGLLEIVSYGSGMEKSTRREALLVTGLISGVCYRKHPESLPVLREALRERSFDGITSNYNSLSYVFFIFEILSIMLREDEKFALFNLLLETMVRINDAGNPENYCIYFIIKFLNSEGLLPGFKTPDDYMIFKADLEKSGFILGNGSIRLIKDISAASNLNFIEDKKISTSVTTNLLNFISLIIKMNYDREIKSISMINTDRIRQ